MAIIHYICMIMVLLYLLFFVPRYCNSAPRKMIIDTDAGGDDALAIMLALEYEAKTREIEIIAITCTYGNTFLKNVEQNVLKTLTVANRNDIPVYGGAQKPLINTYNPDNFFGSDGFGDFNFTQNITAQVNKTQYASVALIDLVKKYPGEITIVNLGPLTNIAIAIALEPHFLYFLKQHIIMGSDASSHNNEKNSSQVEFNFKQDPESDWMVLNNTNKSSTVLSIETVYIHPISKEQYKCINNSLNKNVANFLHQANRLALDKTVFWEPSDGITMAIALQPEIITQSFDTNLDVVLEGNTRGSVKSDLNKVHNAKVVQNFNVTAFINLIEKYLS